jgi:putative ABC transport system permease protein
MKAFGYTNVSVVAHYLKLIAMVGLLGLLIGGGLGVWLGRLLAGVYTDYYSFPLFVFEVNPRVYVIVVAAAAAAVVGGASLSIRRAATLEPATAMTPPQPPDYSRALGKRVTRLKFLDHQTRMILRHIVRFPSRAAFTVAGVAVSGSLMIGTLFFIDSMEEMIDLYFNVANRHDVQVTFVEPRSRSAYFELLRAPGVLQGEPYRSAAARLRFEHREERASVIGLEADAGLARMVDMRRQPVVPPPGGLVLSRDLADKLRVDAGDIIEVEIAEGRRPILDMPVAKVTTTFIGSSAQMRLEDLNRVLREGAVVSGAFLNVDPEISDKLYRELTAAPAVASVMLQNLAQRNFTRLMDQNIGMSIWVYSAFAGLIAIGVVYNSVRISFAERQRELASLRVLGFTRAEVSYILLGEIALTLLALPLGALLGTGTAWGLARAMSSDLFRLPFIIHAATYGYAAFVVITVTAVSGLMVRRATRPHGSGPGSEEP